MLEDHDRERRIVAAVCSATTNLAIHKIGLGRNVTSYPAPTLHLLITWRSVHDQLVGGLGQRVNLTAFLGPFSIVGVPK